MLAALLMAAASCTASPGSDAAPTTALPTTTTTLATTTTRPATTRPTTIPTTTTRPEPAWTVGAQPLPQRPDGLGEILPTPEVLRDRRLPTVSALPPPVNGAFESTIGPITPSIRARMGGTWSPECPVSLDDLRYLTVSFWGLDGGHHTGEIIVNHEVATDVVTVFEQLHEARFPLEEMRIIGDADLDAAPTGDGNNTAAFVCRPMRGGSSWSEHAYGLAVDINPFLNPYVRGNPDSANWVVIPELASAYLDREWHRSGMIQSGDVVNEAFEAIGWTWGGTWSSPDLMHFSRGGR